MGALDDVRLRIIESIDDAMEFKRWLGERREAPLAVDTESSGLDLHRDYIRLVQFGDENTGWTVPWQLWGGVAREALATYDGELVCHNTPFDAPRLELATGIEWPWHRTHDSMYMAHVLDPSKSKALKSLSTRLIDREAGAAQRALDDIMRRNKWTWATVPVDNPYYAAYGALDAVITARLCLLLREKIERGYREPYELELGVARVCSNMTVRGTRLDLGYIDRKSQQLTGYAQSVRRWASEEHGVKNISSNGQILDALKRDGMEFTKHTPKGGTALDKEVLESLEHPLAEAVLSVRKAEKLVGTYLANFAGMAVDGFMHPSIDVCGTRTARMSAELIQLLPKKDATVRDAVVPDDEDHRLVTCDADQIELRLMAHFSGDQGLKEAFGSEEDFFCRIASEMLREPIGKDDHRRKVVKNAAYSRQYGAGPEKIAWTAKVPVERIREVNATFDANYPRVRQFMDRAVNVAQRRTHEEGQAYVTTPGGRRIPVENDKPYTCVNYLIQSTAAETFKRRLMDLDALGLGEHMLMPVHDEVVLSVRARQADEVAKTVQNTMTNTEEFDVPITWSADVLPGAWGGRELT